MDNINVPPVSRRSDSTDKHNLANSRVSLPPFVPIKEIADKNDLQEMKQAPSLAEGQNNGSILEEKFNTRSNKQFIESKRELPTLPSERETSSESLISSRKVKNLRKQSSLVSNSNKRRSNISAKKIETNTSFSLSNNKDITYINSASKKTYDAFFTLKRGYTDTDLQSHDYAYSNIFENDVRIKLTSLKNMWEDIDENSSGRKISIKKGNGSHENITVSGIGTRTIAKSSVDRHDGCLPPSYVGEQRELLVESGFTPPKMREKREDNQREDKNAGYDIRQIMKGKKREL